MVGTDASVFYTVKQGQLGCTTQWDWIGLYRHDFGSLDDWLVFNYASSCRRSGVTKSVVFSGASLSLPGRFVLIYRGRDECVLGVSRPFDVLLPGRIELAEEAREGVNYHEE